MVRVRTECCHGFIALTVVLVTDSRGFAGGRPKLAIAAEATTRQSESSGGCREAVKETLGQIMLAGVAHHFAHRSSAILGSSPGPPR
jgi:hypothetical protein